MFQRRRIVVKELDWCINEIRRLPGYDCFLLGQTIDKMQNCAAEGRIVVINITKMQSDAIIVSLNGTKTINLPALGFSEVKNWLQKGATEEKGERGKRNCEFLQYLSFL